MAVRLMCIYKLYIMKIKNYIINEKFYSKKNLVYKITVFLTSPLDLKFKTYSNSQYIFEKSKIINAVLKRYNKNRVHVKGKEVSILTKLKEAKCNVPMIYLVNEDTIFMEYLEGKTLLNVIEEMEDSNLNSIQVLRNLYLWICDFYASLGGDIIFGDVNLRNFILNNEKIYGIDFEDCRIGKKEEDMGKLCAYFLTYNPSFTDWKIKNVKDFFMMLINEFGFNQEELLREIEKELVAMERRRNEIYAFGDFIECL